MGFSATSPLGSRARRAAGIVFFAIGIAVFLIRLHHEGPYAFPEGGNLRAGILAILLGVWFSRPSVDTAGIGRFVNWIALAPVPITATRSSLRSCS